MALSSSEISFYYQDYLQFDLLVQAGVFYFFQAFQFHQAFSKLLLVQELTAFLLALFRHLILILTYLFLLNQIIITQVTPPARFGKINREESTAGGKLNL